MFAVFIWLIKSFVNSVRSLKGPRGKDTEILVPVGVTVTTDDDRILGRSKTASCHMLVFRLPHMMYTVCCHP